MRFDVTKVGSFYEKMEKESGEAGGYGYIQVKFKFDPLTAAVSVESAVGKWQGNAPKPSKDAKTAEKKAAKEEKGTSDKKEEPNAGEPETENDTEEAEEDLTKDTVDLRDFKGKAPKKKPATKAKPASKANTKPGAKKASKEKASDKDTEAQPTDDKLKDGAKKKKPDPKDGKNGVKKDTKKAKPAKKAGGPPKPQSMHLSVKQQTMGPKPLEGKPFYAAQKRLEKLRTLTKKNTELSTAKHELEAALFGAKDRLDERKQTCLSKCPGAPDPESACATDCEADQSVKDVYDYIDEVDQWIESVDENRPAVRIYMRKIEVLQQKLGPLLDAPDQEEQSAEEETADPPVTDESKDSAEEEADQDSDEPNAQDDEAEGPVGDDDDEDTHDEL
eukprot:NODE_1228_length_1825_cov_61.162162_g1165_i0.p1 GENE.NODE_1228_length_1825_cov_61.162162_g1165_i0~~NODE_1228_length_1825_cov_61.162162_g1165_i0.p1  ORF type:complete len:389 (-),score=121.50 NODE_1228_length_1825_cov_61.162162_g1165_i0:149-1315(-)